MKIGIDARWIFPEITGIGSYTQELIRHLARVQTGHEFVLFFNETSVRDRTIEYAALADQHAFTTLTIPERPFTPASQWRMPRLIAQHALDVFHSTNFMLPFFAFPRRRCGRTAAVITIHDLIPLLFPEHTPKALKSRFHPVFKAVMREAGTRADLIITVSEASRRDILEHMHIPAARHHRVVSIYEGVAARYKPAPATPASPATILYVGRMDPYKNVPQLVRVFARLVRQSAKPLRLQMIGPRDARYPQVAETIAAEQMEAHIDWPGYVDGDALLRAYQMASVFVLPSLYEGFGLPVLEAMACGTPVICSDRASLPEVAGDAALLVNPDSEDDLLRALTSVLDDSATAARLRTKGLERARAFTWEQTARHTLAAYARAVQTE
jgi:glycosyltransferase involved in cell wall biosynthesis